MIGLLIAEYLSFVCVSLVIFWLACQYASRARPELL